jgi:hypothetical protein
MKLAPPAAALVWAVAVAVGAQPAEPRPEPRALPACPNIVARIDGQPISRAQLRLKGEIGARIDPAVQGNLEGAYQNGMNDLIRRQLLFQEAQAHHFEAEPSAVDVAEKELRGSLGDETAVDGFLASLGVDRRWLRHEAWIQETARTYAGCVAEEQVPAVTDAEALFFYRAYNPEAGDPPPELLNSWRAQVERNKRNMALREQLDTLTAKAKVERIFVRGQCAP